MTYPRASPNDHWQQSMVRVPGIDPDVQVRRGGRIAFVVFFLLGILAAFVSVVARALNPDGRQTMHTGIIAAGLTCYAIAVVVGLPWWLIEAYRNRTHRGRTALVALIVLGLTAVGAGAWRHNLETRARASAALPVTVTSRHTTLVDSCVPKVPAGAPTTVVAYVHVLAAGMPNRERLDATLKAERDLVRRTDLKSEIQADKTFMAAFGRIHFGRAGRAAAQRLTSAMSAYLRFLQKSYTTTSYFRSHQATDQALNHRRDAAASALRAKLRLPASPCTLARP